MRKKGGGGGILLEKKGRGLLHIMGAGGMKEKGTSFQIEGDFLFGRAEKRENSRGEGGGRESL